MSIQDHREARAAKAKLLHTVAAKTDFSSADQTSYDTLHAEITSLDAAIERINTANALVAADSTRAGVIDAALRVGHDQKSEACKAFALFLSRKKEDQTPDERTLIMNTMSVGGAGSEGGYTVPTEVVSALIVAMKKYGALRDVATVLKTATGHPMSFPTADPTSELGEIVAENAVTTALDTAFGTLSLPCYMYSSKSVAVPLQLLQDSVIDIQGYVINVLGMRLGRITNLHYTVGTGTAQPNGAVTAATVGYTAANATSQVTAVKGDSLIELFHSIDPAYRDLKNVAFMFNDKTLKVIRQLKDNNARYMFLPGFETGVPGGVPDTLLGVPIVINQQVADMTAGARSILYGDFSFYTIRDAMDVLIRRFDDSAFGLKGQVGFCAWMRSGGNLLDVGGAVKAFVNAAS